MSEMVQQQGLKLIYDVGEERQGGQIKALASNRPRSVIGEVKVGDHRKQQSEW